RHAQHSLFFFQAEDGIRDLIVTGVQTCALPISLSSGRVPSLPSRIVSVADCFDAITSKRSYRKPEERRQALSILQAGAGRAFDRSEERRVGKGRRGRRARRPGEQKEAGRTWTAT